MTGFVKRSKHRMRSMHLPVSCLALLILSLSVIPGGAADDPRQAAPAADKPPVMQVTYANKLLSVTAKDADVRGLIKTIGARAGFPVNLDPSVTGKVTLEFKDLAVNEGIMKVLSSVGQKNLATEFSRKPGAGKDDLQIERLSVVRKAPEPTEAEVRAAMQQREREYRELFARLDKEKNKIAKALKEYADSGTSHDKKIKLRTYIRQTSIDDPKDKELVKGAIIDPQYQEIRSDLQMAMLHTMESNPEPGDKDYIVELLNRKDNTVGWLYYAMLNQWDDRYLPFLLDGARRPPRSRMEIELLGRLKIKEAVPLLEEALKDKDSIIQGAAWDALLQITGKKYEIQNSPK